MLVPGRDGEEKPYSSAVAVERAVDLLFLIAERGEASLTDLARAIGSSGSAVHRILTALKRKGLIQQPLENGPYSLSWSILALTQRLTAEADVRSLSLPFMVELRDLTGETVTINVRSGYHRVCIDQVEGPHEVRWRQDVGKVSPLYAGATGKAILAYLSPQELKDYLRTVKLEKLTPYTTVDRREIERELGQIRERGCAFGTQDRVLGVAGISAPVFDAHGAVAATLTIAGPSERCTDEQLHRWAEPLTRATNEISSLLSLHASSGAVTPASLPEQEARRPSRRRLAPAGAAGQTHAF
jgi:IclR family acetate operon transcriptional repressor